MRGSVDHAAAGQALADVGAQVVGAARVGRRAALVLDDVRLGRVRQPLADLGVDRLAGRRGHQAALPVTSRTFSESAPRRIDAQWSRRARHSSGGSYASLVATAVSTAVNDAALQQGAGAGGRQQGAQVGQVGPAPDDRVDGGLGWRRSCGTRPAAGRRARGRRVHGSRPRRRPAPARRRPRRPRLGVGGDDLDAAADSSAASASSAPNRATRRGAAARSSRRGRLAAAAASAVASGAPESAAAGSVRPLPQRPQAATSTPRVAGTVATGPPQAPQAAGSGARAPWSANSRSRHLAAKAALARA